MITPMKTKRKKYCFTGIFGIEHITRRRVQRSVSSGKNNYERTLTREDKNQYLQTTVKFSFCCIDTNLSFIIFADCLNKQL